jgi:mitogen-activated protein kinase kinase kinase 3
MSFIYARGQCETKFNVRPKSPGPGSRGPTSPTSPLHARLHVLSLDSPTGKQEDGRSECHPLPLPPGSPTSPSLPNNTRSNVLLENSTASRGRWKKGKLLGRGTFGHVYLGFNRYWLFFFFFLFLRCIFTFSSFSFSFSCDV